MHISSLPLPAHILSPAATGLLSTLALTLIAALAGPTEAIWATGAFLAIQTVLLLTVATNAFRPRLFAPLIALTALATLTTSLLLLPLGLLIHALWAVLHQSARIPGHLPRPYLYFTLTADLTAATVLTFVLHFTQ